MIEAVDDPTERDATNDDPTVSPHDPTSHDAVGPTDVVGDGSPDGAATETGTSTVIDVAGIEADLDGVEAALGRLADGTYWTDEVTGERIPADVLAANPLARRA